MSPETKHERFTGRVMGKVSGGAGKMSKGAIDGAGRVGKGAIGGAGKALGMVSKRRPSVFGGSGNTPFKKRDGQDGEDHAR